MERTTMAGEKVMNRRIDLNVEPESGNTCSICLDLISAAVGARAFAKLQCGHEFHLDCIGSAFNMKGTMQCPNCRTIENGRWLYANGSTSSPAELSMDDGSADVYPNYIDFTEMPYRVHVCPFRGLTQVHSMPDPNIILSTMTPMMSHQHPGPHPHGWVQFHHAPFQVHHPLPPSLPLPPITSGGRRFDSQRNFMRFIPPSRVYEPSAGFSMYGEVPMNYSNGPWVRDTHLHCPMQ